MMDQWIFADAKFDIRGETKKETFENLMDLNFMILFYISFII